MCKISRKAQIQQSRLLSRDFEHASEIALKKIFRSSNDWRYRHLLQKMNVFQVIPYMMKARLKSTPYKDTVVHIGRCSTDTGKITLVVFLLESDLSPDFKYIYSFVRSIRGH